MRTTYNNEWQIISTRKWKLKNTEENSNKKIIMIWHLLYTYAAVVCRCIDIVIDFIQIDEIR